MATPVTVLVTSAGRRVGLLECFRAAGDALGVPVRVIAGDMRPELSSACAVADQAYALPRCKEAGYAEAVLAVAEREAATLVVPTIDPELMPLAMAAPRFLAKGVRLHVSDPEVIEVVRDKVRTSEVLAGANVPTPETMTLDELRARPGALPWPVFLKPVAGSASRGLMLAHTPTDLPEQPDEPMMAQEYLTGKEHTVNVFVDPHGAVQTVVPHERLSIRAGEVEKGVTVRSPQFRALAEGIVAALPGLRGVFCFQTINDARGAPRVIEINARFGGGYPLADRAGATFARWLVEDASGAYPKYHDNWREGVLMLRYDSAIFTETNSQCLAANL